MEDGCAPILVMRERKRWMSCQELNPEFPENSAGLRYKVWFECAGQTPFSRTFLRTGGQPEQRW
jgi:hypothetical protein